MENLKLPQLRMLVTDYCDSKCIYCRPTGEGNLDSRHLDMNYDVAVKIAKAYQRLGGSSIKISGGDPVFWNNLIEYIKHLKIQLNYDKVELITRSVQICRLLNDLKLTGLDVLNFSLDTLNEKWYNHITQKNDFERYKKIICECARIFFCKINTVILPDTAESEIYDMIEFCAENGIRELKLLDYIDDLVDKQPQTYSDSLFERIYQHLDNISPKYEIEFQGGLGHPMRVYKISDYFRVICKDARQGAWYCDLCRKCGHYPCHDALMAVRVTPSNSFQLCLLNDKMHWRFDSSNIEEQLVSIIKHYQNASFERKINENNRAYPT